MIEIDVPGRQVYRLEHLVMDLNGTIAVDGSIVEGVPERLALLRRSLNIVVVTADTRGIAQDLEKTIGFKTHRVERGDEKAQKGSLVQQLGKDITVSVGNGSNDSLMLKTAILGICVLGDEGASAEAIASCDVLAPSISSALDLLLKPDRLIATIRR